MAAAIDPDDLEFKTLPVRPEGYFVMINYDESKPRLIFMNNMRQKDGKIKADVFAFIEFDNMDQLKELKKEIDQTIWDVENREA